MYIRIIWRRDITACMQYALPYESNNRTKNTLFFTSGTLPFKQMLCSKKMVRLLNSIKDVLHWFTYCISARNMCLFQELVCLCVDSFWRNTVPLLKKTNTMEENETKAHLHQTIWYIGCFHKIYINSFLARIVLFKRMPGRLQPASNMFLQHFNTNLPCFKDCSNAHWPLHLLRFFRNVNHTLHVV